MFFKKKSTQEKLDLIEARIKALEETTEGAISLPHSIVVELTDLRTKRNFLQTKLQRRENEPR